MVSNIALYNNIKHTGMASVNTYQPAITQHLVKKLLKRIIVEAKPKGMACRIDSARSIVDLIILECILVYTSS